MGRPTRMIHALGEAPMAGKCGEVMNCCCCSPGAYVLASMCGFDGSGHPWFAYVPHAQKLDGRLLAAGGIGDDQTMIRLQVRNMFELLTAGRGGQICSGTA